MQFSGGGLFGPYPAPELIRVMTNGYPDMVRVSAEPNEYYCGGSTAGVQLTTVGDNNFEFTLYTDCVAHVSWTYGHRYIPPGEESSHS